MAFWLTTQWPLRKGEVEHRGVYVTDAGRPVIARLEPGDLVAIYESATGRTRVVKNADGSDQRLPCGPGRQGVVGLHEVVGLAAESEENKPENYVDGTIRWWRWTAPTEPVSTTGFVPRNTLNELLGFAPAYNYRGYGERHSGLAELTSESFATVAEAFKSSQDSKLRKPIEMLRNAVKRGGTGGEGPAHRALKELIAASPDILGEDGLTLVRVEMPFPTGDRIDVVLADRFGRLVAVEVEGPCDATEVCGPLQCAKYRALLSYAFGRPIDEVRAILAAPSIDSSLVKRCGDHRIETIQIPVP